MGLRRWPSGMASGSTKAEPIPGQPLKFRREFNAYDRRESRIIKCGGNLMGGLFGKSITINYKVYQFIICLVPIVPLKPVPGRPAPTFYLQKHKM
jgi:hypothetical protein